MGKILTVDDGSFEKMKRQCREKKNVSNYPVSASLSHLYLLDSSFWKAEVCRI